MTELKNCPNCGGVLDDTGRCLYCKSKVYDLTDIKIDPLNREPIILQFMYGEQSFTMKCYMTEPIVEIQSSDIDAYRDVHGRLHRIEPKFKRKVSLKFIEY